MRAKEEIFKDIQKVMSSDYAGYANKKYVNNPDQYNISNDMDDRTFEETIQEYLLDFQDGHLWFAAQESSLPNRGFSVRRYEDALYVIDSSKEDRLEVGDKIIKIDDEDIPTLAIRY